ncbi:MAG: RNA polymerase sigma factor [Bacteroidales bacterium]|nr:RNA polymerase sigma factor [Bacteroidales bacterium]
MTEKDYKQHINNYSDGVLRYLVKNLQDMNDAKDILQDTFTALWQDRTKIDNSKVKNWLFITAHNKMLKLIRYNKIRQETSSINDLNEPSNPKTHNNYENKQQCDILLEKLPETMKQCLMLKEWSGFSIKEIARTLQISEENVKINIFRAKVKAKLLTAN